MTTFFTADQHFGHARAIEMNNRPFTDVDQMNVAMIAGWNAIVQPTDTVYHLGDFAYGKRVDRASIWGQLHGEKHLVIGNHDHSNGTLDLDWQSAGHLAEVTIDGTSVVLCHYPLLELRGFHRHARHLFGHVHGTRIGMPGSSDVGVDVWNFAPISWAQAAQSIEDDINQHLSQQG